MAALAPAPPSDSSYPKASGLHPPLSAITKAGMYAYLLAHGYTDNDIATYVTSGNTVLLPTTQFSLAGYVATNSNPAFASLDTAFIQAYASVQAGGGFGHAGVKTVGPDLNPWDWVKNTLLNGTLWARVGEFAVGGILIAVGANAMLKGRK